MRISATTIRCLTTEIAPLTASISSVGLDLLLLDSMASVGTIWTFLDRCALTVKKRPLMQPSRIGLMS